MLNAFAMTIGIAKSFSYDVFRINVMLIVNIDIQIVVF